jgi:adenine-specific DNA-methyltransferase
MDEVFGADHFIATCIWHKVYSPKNTAQFFSEDHDYLLVYAKNKSIWRPALLGRTEAMENRYINPDNDPRGLWKPSDLTARNPYSKGKYTIIGPTGKAFDSGTRYWRQSYESLKKLDEDKRIWWGEDGGNMPSQKRFLSEVKAGIVPQTIWDYSEVGHTQDAKKELLSIFNYQATDDVFISPKPVALLSKVLAIATQEESVILDSFAGSGTTAHAVLEANRKDGGNRRFILVECEDYADTLTAERVRRVINGYAFKGTKRTELHREKITWSAFEKKQRKIIDRVESIERLEGGGYDKVAKEIKDGILIVTGERHIEEKVPGLGGSFTFCTLGEPIEIESLLTGKGLPAFGTLARYVFYTATGRSLESVAAPSADGFIGETELFRIHLFYQPDTAWLRSNEAALNAERVEAVAKGNTTGKRAIVFAVAKFMSQKELTARRIEFCQLPYAVHRILGE